MPPRTLQEITSQIPPGGQNPITMAAHVVGLLPQGGRRVRLANDHELDVLAEGGRRTELSRIGDIVAITLGQDRPKAGDWSSCPCTVAGCFRSLTAVFQSHGHFFSNAPNNHRF